MSADGTGLLLGLALIGDGVHCGRNGLLIAEVVALDRPKIGVELVNQRNAGRDVQLQDLLLGEVLEILHKRAEAVAMGGDDYLFSGLYSRSDFFMPEWKEAIDRILEALGKGEF